MQQKTLLMVAPYFPPHSGGLERYVQEIATILQNKYAWRIVVVTSGTKGGNDYEEEVEGLKVYRLGYEWTLSNTPLSLGWFSKIRNICKIENPSILNIHMPVPGIGDVAALASTTRNIIVTYHAGTMRKRHVLYDPIIFAYEQTFLRLLLGRARHIICSSDYVRDSFLTKYRSKSSTVTPGVDLGLFHPDEDESHKRPTLLFVASLTKSQRFKNLDVLIQAVRILRTDIPNILLKVVGDGNLKKEYQMLAERLGIGENVRFEGYLSGAKLAKAFQSCDVLALISALPAESFGMVLLEAMACGKPVVGAKTGGIPIIIDDGKNGFLVASNDMQALCTALKTLLEDKALAQRMGAVGLEQVRHGYSWDIKAEQYDKTLTSIL